jgi:glycine cleavage system H protein
MTGHLLITTVHAGSTASVFSRLLEMGEVNDALEDDPGLVNTDPYGDGWLFRLEPADPSELDGLMNADDYSDAIEA